MATDTKIADYNRSYSTKKAEYMTRVGEAQAEADLAYELEASKQEQIIVAEKLNVDLSEFRQILIKSTGEVALRKKVI